MRQRHGVPDARKVTMVASGEKQFVTVTDGGEGEVFLSIGSADYPAGLTVEQARFIALLLDEASDRAERKKDGRAKGGQAGGRVRAERLSPERRSEIATAAANARWKK